jgi:tripartite-type tricarboxylate transporter receptor subunit TctC
MTKLRASSLWILALAALLLDCCAVLAQDFYKDKTIRFIVGQAAGGGYDAYTRIVARYMGKYIPGNPAIVVENMTGAVVWSQPTMCTATPSPTA